MRLTALVVGAAIFVAAVLVNKATVSAEAFNSTQTKTTTQATTQPSAFIALLSEEKLESKSQPANWVLRNTAPDSSPQPATTYAVKEGDTLSSIAELHKTDWMRLWQKNTSLAHPDTLKTGDTIQLPVTGEILVARELPQPPVEEKMQPAAAPVAAKKTAVATAPTSTMGSSSGNRYTAGYCTWYVKNMRPDLPNNLGNADTWVARAAAQGMATGSEPRVGAVGQRNMHVVYVEQVNGDGTIVISEMNYQQLWVKTVRTVAADYFTYIY